MPLHHEIHDGPRRAKPASALTRLWRWAEGILMPYIASPLGRRVIIGGVCAALAIGGWAVVRGGLGHKGDVGGDVAFDAPDSDVMPLGPSSDDDPADVPEKPKADGGKKKLTPVAKPERVNGSGGKRPKPAAVVALPEQSTEPPATAGTATRLLPAPAIKPSSIEALRIRSADDNGVKLTVELLKERIDKSSKETADLLAQRITRHARMDLPTDARDTLLFEFGRATLGSTSDQLAAPVLDAMAEYLPQDLEKIGSEHLFLAAGLTLSKNGPAGIRLKAYVEQTLDPTTPRNARRRGFLGHYPEAFYMVGAAVGRTLSMTQRQLVVLSQQWFSPLPDEQFNFIAGYFDAGNPRVGPQDVEDLLQFLASPDSRDSTLMKAGPDVMKWVPISELILVYSLRESKDLRSSLLKPVAQIRLNSYRAAVLRFTTPQERKQVPTADLQKLIENPWLGTDAVFVVGGTEDSGRMVSLGQWAAYLDALIESDKAAGVQAAYRTVLGSTALWTGMKHVAGDGLSERYRVHALRKLLKTDPPTAVKAAGDLLLAFVDEKESRPRSHWMVTACLGTFAVAGRPPDAALVKRLYAKREALGDKISNLDGEDYARGQVTGYALAAGLIPRDDVAWSDLPEYAKVGALDVLSGLGRQKEVESVLNATKLGGNEPGTQPKRWVALGELLVPGIDYDLMSRLLHADRFERKEDGLNIFRRDVEKFLSGQLRAAVLAWSRHGVGT
jgi:hypothetical protein